MDLEDFEVVIPQEGDTWDEFGPIGTTPLNNKINRRFWLDSPCEVRYSSSITPMEQELELPEPYSQEFWETYRMADLAWQVDTWLSKTCWWNSYED